MHKERIYDRTHITSRRKSDIENERLPPDLVDPEDVAPHLSSPGTPSDEGRASPSANGIKSAIEAAIANGTTTPTVTSNADASATPGTPASGTGSGTISSPFRRGHGRQASLGTTMTSPSTRRRSIESTISLIKEAVDGKQDSGEITELADQLSSPIRERHDPTKAAGT